MGSSADSYERVTEYYQRAIAGHVYIRETLDALFETLRARIRGLGRAPRILELGSHAGVITELLLQNWPDAEIVVHDEDEALVSMAQRRLAGRAVRYHTGPLDTLSWRADLVISVARHHHLPHDYLVSLRRVMLPGTMYIVADELCPEYCQRDHASRIEQAQLLHIVGGYVLTSQAEVEAYEQEGKLPQPALELERRRQHALWRWYRFVVDHAVENGYVDVAVGELQSTHDDLITGSDAEHKFSPLIVERQFSLAGFRLFSKRMVGPADEPERQSMFVYEYGLR
jgi:hypothetical protein